jgi:hypothetical protein
LEQQRIIVERDVPGTQAREEPDLFDANIQRPADKFWIHERNRTVRTTKRTSFSNLENASMRVDAFPEWKTIRQRQAERPEIQAFEHLIRTKRFGVLRADTAVNTTQNDFGLRLQPSDIIDDFAHARIPVRHYRLNEHSIEMLSRKKVQEVLPRPAKPVIPARDVGQWSRLCDRLPVELPAAKRIALPRDQIIKRREFASAELARDAKQSIRTQPEIKGREVVDRWIHEKQVHGIERTLTAGMYRWCVAPKLHTISCIFLDAFESLYVF